MSWCVRIAVVWIVLLGAACGPNGRTTRPATTGADDTTLGLDDVFDVRVFGESDLSGSYRVGQGGTIDFPLVGQLHVLGREPTEVAAMIGQALREGGYLVNPQVSVFVQEYNSKRISVLGAVGSPGNFEMRSGLTVVQAIGTAGGFAPLANRDGTYVTRRVGDEIQRFSVPVDRITSGQDPDFPLQAGDIVFVPERLF